MSLALPTDSQVEEQINRGEYVPHRSEDKLVVSTIGKDTKYRKVCVYSVRVDYEDKKLEEVTRTVIQRYRFFDDAYQAWTESLKEGTLL